VLVFSSFGHITVPAVCCISIEWLLSLALRCLSVNSVIIVCYVKKFFLYITWYRFCFSYSVCLLLWILLHVYVAENGVYADFIVVYIHRCNCELSICTITLNVVLHAQKTITAETKSHAGDMPITVDEYSDLKHSLKESEMRMQQLLQSNTKLGEEVALLQNMASCSFDNGYCIL